MRKRISLCGGVILLALAAALTGCDPNKGGEKPADTGTVTNTPAASAPAATAARAAEAFNKPRKADGSILIKVITNGNSPFWDSMGEGLKVGIKEIGADPQSGWSAPQQTDNNSQKAVFEQALAAGVDGVAVSPIQADAFAPVIDAAVEKGIPVITFDSDAPNSKRLAYIGTNNLDAGRKAGEAAIKLFPNGGSLVAFVGNMTADNAKQRYQGFLDAVKGHHITMLQDPYEDDKDATGRAHANVADAITKYGSKIDGFLGLYSYNGPAIVTEVQKAGLVHKVKILCFDGEPKTLENLGKGLVDVTVVQKPYEFGRLSARLLYLINRKGLDAALKEMDPELDRNGMKRSGNNIDTGVEVVTPANAPAFLKELQDKGLKST
jgi:ribose transport system substrate-binding protein